MAISQSAPIILALSLSTAIHAGVLLAAGSTTGFFGGATTEATSNSETLIHLRDITITELSGPGENSTFEVVQESTPPRLVEPIVVKDINADGAVVRKEPALQRIARPKRSAVSKRASSAEPRLSLPGSPVIPSALSAASSLTDVTADGVPSTHRAKGFATGTAPRSALTDYTFELITFLERSHRYPELLRRANLEGRVVARIQLSRSGALESVTILETSGSERIDREVSRFVEGLAPYPPFPKRLEASSLAFSVPITLKLQRR